MKAILHKPWIKQYVLPLGILILAIIGFIFLSQQKPDVRKSNSNAATTSQSSPPASADSSKNDTKAKTGSSSVASKADDSNSEKTEENRSNRSRGFGRGGLLAQTNAATVNLMEIEASTWSPELPLFGKVIAKQSLTSLSPGNLTITSVQVSPGQQVNQGQLLLTLDATDLEISKRQTEARVQDLAAKIRLQDLQQNSDIKNLEVEKKLLAISDKTVKRHENLNSQQLSSSSEYETALRAYQTQLMQVQSRQTSIDKHKDIMQQLKAQHNELIASLERIDNQIKETQIRAKFDGVIASIQANQGDQVSVNSPLVTLFDPKSLALETRIPIKWIQDVSISDQAIMANGLFNNTTYQLQLSELDAVSDKGSVKAVFQFYSVPPQALGQHMAITAKLPHINNIFRVPANMVYESALVFKVENQRLVDIPIQIKGQNQIEGKTWYLITGPNLTSGVKLLATRLPNATKDLRVKLATDSVVEKNKNSAGNF